MGTKIATPLSLDAGLVGLPATLTYTTLLGRSDTLVLRLPSAPSTGYGWSLSASDGGLQSLVSAFEPLSSDPDVVGASGAECFAIELDGTAGPHTLEFSLRRTFESTPALCLLRVHIDAH